MILSAAMMLSGGMAHAEVKKFRPHAGSLILEGAEVSADSRILYLSGQLPPPVRSLKSRSTAPSVADYGDTRTQTINILKKIKGLLEKRGYSMSDLIKLTIFLAPDPRTGRLDYDGANAGFRQFFNTRDNPSTVARSAFGVASLAAPQYLVEIEAIAARDQNAEETKKDKAKDISER